ncbi:hypothetical protein MPTK1_2g03960 [Marchantia polymorpha subsp. ruderalis]|uniref:Uncharacterized protein n=2 Tax=Marchantia polymorpha TaxID=3197 RepID=A0A176VTP9_MARPO|nr:hypothetical protein AXG93_2752s1800 [Marchantia polymorpha subsp. ruderalis]PTQ42068.1 hypothetical protein MARPO_0031s0052 [Marchantia polymorpha]PTQ42069.1 hypothetical protein MARPO_0031s0052 [Marchantia polymorpha]PTQ42070.1 hypothetical protein MARPO_0031s0052 [Marchantia polymorpha]BBN01019.1 hypothetical protein Mp_2g03960 [Marchantia polymorpha subsp. ruderalis]|eukprot:PTQ42068.1 hypothetical protein MARPO_0031s0052 [Marchantia polymorpha]
MSLQAVALATPNKACRFTTLVTASSCGGEVVRKASFVQQFSLPRRVKSTRHLELKLRHISSSSCFYTSLGTFRSVNRPARLQATSLQAVTADSDSSSGDVVGPSAQAMSLSSVELNHFLVAFLSRLQEGFRKMKERGLLQSTKQGFEEAFVKLKSGDGKLVLEEDLGSKISSQGAATWQALKPWVKWPLAIFVSVFMVVTAVFGTSVSRDLVPLWILGPLVTGTIIRTVYWVADATREAVVRSEPSRQAFVQGVAQVVEDAKNGELVDKIKISMEEKNRELRELAATKRSEFVVYVQSGQAASDFKMYMQLRYSDFSDWSNERYEDFVDWWRPFLRAFIRLMKKLF